MEFQIIRSNKGGEKMIRDGNMYVIKRRNGRRVSWECVKRRVNGCKARASTDLQFNDATFFHAHCHTPDYVNVSVTKAKASIKENAANSNEHPAGIYAQVVADCDEETRLRLPEEKSLKRTIQRSRGTVHPPEPASLQDLTVEGDYALTERGHERFLMYDNGVHARNRIIVFASDADLRCLAAARIYMMDGNFKMAPKQFLQLYVIHVPVGQHTSVPLVYAFMQRKSEESYNEMLNAIREKAEELGLVLQPELIIVDFELAIHNASVRVLGALVSIGGCFYHFSNGTWRKVQDLALVERYVFT